LEEYRDSEDAEAASDCLKEIHSPLCPEWTIYKLILFAVEGKDRDRRIFLDLLQQFYKSNIFTPQHFLSGFTLVLDKVDDLVLDSPHAHKYISPFLAFGLMSKSIEPQSFVTLLSPLLVTSAATIAAETLLAIQDVKGLEEAKSFASQLDFTQFLKPILQNPEFLDKLGALKPILLM